jgi:hypothetical protein
MSQAERELLEAVAQLPRDLERKLEQWSNGDQEKARERFRRYAERAAEDLPVGKLNYLAHRIAMLLDGDAGMRTVDQEIREERP